MTPSWSPFAARGRQRREEPPRSRGRRRQRPQAAAGGSDAVLTDRDAAAAAQAAQQGRAQSLAPAWERFGSEPLSPRRTAGHDDRVLRLADAELDHCGTASPADTRMRDGQLHSACIRDYGTGSGYDIAQMS